MPTRTMRRTASQNRYFHPDFHCALNCGLNYLYGHYGAEAVTAYLWRFAAEFYAPLSEAICERGLAALREHLARIYSVEGVDIELLSSEAQLTVSVPWCPALKRIRERGETVCPVFVETTRTVNHAICDPTPYVFELRSYDATTGSSVQRFARRPS